MVPVHVAYWPDPCELPPGAGVAPLLTAVDAALAREPRHALTTILFKEAFANIAQTVSFRAEDARDFYFHATRGSLRIHDRDIAVTPAQDHDPAPPHPPSSSPHPASPDIPHPPHHVIPPGPLPGDDTRSVAVRVFNHPLLVLTRAKLRADFGRFGEIERVWYHPCVACTPTSPSRAQTTRSTRSSTLPSRAPTTRALMAAEQARDRPLGVRSMRIAGLRALALAVHTDTGADTGSRLKGEDEAGARAV
ncbi:hypothetical protein B0H17DRAFT_1121131 [Mycena rosella]|uniref:Uncharacterized protein n=1 Tax=Mycena rosella TaxID=1033263 RepID=A0AAD7F6A9_MYCRO|nr:hypothetical protein B0H17DRAFT_1121131 [Mycena rosella]